MPGPQQLSRPLTLGQSASSPARGLSITRHALDQMAELAERLERLER